MFTKTIGSAIIVTLCAAAYAGTAFTDLNYPANINDNWGFGGDLTTYFRFESGLTGKLSCINLDISDSQIINNPLTGTTYQDTTPYGFYVTLYQDLGKQDNGLDYPGKAIESWGLVTNPSFQEIITVADGPQLTAGEFYWLGASSPFSPDVAWDSNADGYTGLVYESWASNPSWDVNRFDTSGAFKVQVAGAPSPAAAIPFVAGVVSYARRRRRA